MEAPVSGAPPTFHADDALRRVTRSGGREERVAAVRTYLDAARAELARRHAALAGVDGGMGLARFLSDALERLVRALFDAAVERARPGPVALCAIGGFGRGELSPYSDLDLVFLHGEGEGAATDDALRELAEEVLYPLWDCRLDVGHAVRDVGGSVELARSDLTACTALLDARRIAGDAALAEALRGEADRALFAAGPNELVSRLAEEKAARHARFGDTVFLLEPNLKNGNGGLRDLLTGIWAARARWRVARLEDLVAIGGSTPRQVAALGTARDRLLRIRAAAHLHARRRQDQLLFEIQEAIAPSLFPDARPGEGEIRPAVAPAVEALMQTYYLCAKAVARETDRLLERSIIPPPKPPMLRRLDASFSLFGGKVTVNEPGLFRERPSDILRLFRVALDTGAPVYVHAKELIADALADEAVVARLRDDRAAAADFVALLCDARDARSQSLVEELHEVGALVALLPEYGPCTGRVQHDLYHVYTVDQHQLYAVAQLKALARGELAETHPVATAALGQVTRRAPLFLGTLLHDVGKPLGKGHSEKGARLAVQVARRLGFSDEDVAQTEFLVKQHLLMAHLSQRRDLHDAATVADLAAQVGDEETRRELYLLTFADMSMVAPGNLSEWKETLLRELYVRTSAYLRRGADLAELDRSRVVERRRGRVAALLGERPGDRALERFFAGLPDRYFLANPPRAIVRHVRLSRGRGDRVLATAIEHRPRKGFSEVSLVARDVPGLLARVTGVLFAHRVDVLGAEVASRGAGTPDDPAEAVDLFRIRDRYGRALDGEGRWDGIAADLDAVLAGRTDVDALVAGRREPSSLPARRTPPVATEIKVDNHASERFTVVDVYTQDRPGVLYAITRTLSRLGLDIVLSKVATEATRVADVFYVRGPDGGKVTGAVELEKLRASLGAALASLAETPR